MAKAKRRRKPASFMMVIRVRVPARYADDMKVFSVVGHRGSRGPRGRLHSLEPLNAYYDRPGQPGVDLYDHGE